MGLGVRRRFAGGDLGSYRVGTASLTRLRHGAQPLPESGRLAVVPVKRRDTWWTVLVTDPLAIPVVYRIQGWQWVTPNRLTAASAAVGLGAAALMATHHFVVGALAYQASFLLDCMDGKLAALRSTSSRWGGFFDAAGDAVRFVSCAAAMAYALSSMGWTSPWQVALVAAYPSIRWATLFLGDARPSGAREGKVVLEASPAAVLRASRARLGWPGSTVDTEAIAFTVGPLVGYPFAGMAVAAGVDVVHSMLLAGQAVRATLGSRFSKDREG